MSGFFQVKDFYDSSGKVCISENGLKNLVSLAQIILNKHYSYALISDREDLQQAAILKALELLNNGMFDVKRSSLKNYLYTGMMNEMKNYIYRNYKEVYVDDEVLLGLNEAKQSVVDEAFSFIEVSENDIYDAAGRLIKNEVILNKVKSYLKAMGFNILYNGVPRIRKEVEMIVCLIIWRKMRV